MSDTRNPEPGGSGAGAPAAQELPFREGKALPKAKGRFNITIRSVYYYVDEESACAAVVIGTGFILDNGKRLKYARCPLRISSVAEGDNQERFGVRHHYPAHYETVGIEYTSGSKKLVLAPRVEAFQIGAELGSYERKGKIREAKLISLEGKLEQEALPRISWYYKDEKETHYPPDVDVLIVVQKPNAGEEGPTQFPFKLQLTRELKIDIHSNAVASFVTDLADRLVGVPDSGEDGWFFRIRGNFNSELAKQALKSTEAPNTPLVGLRKAAESLLESLQHQEK